MKAINVSVKGSILFLLVVTSLGFADSYLDVKRDGKIFTLEAYVDVERSADDVWPYLWEFHHMKGYIDNVQRIDSLTGGKDWYLVRFVGDFPFVHTEVSNRKWIIEQGRSIGAKATECKLETVLPLKVVSSEGYWRIEPLGNSRSRVHYKTVVEVYAAGFEGLYTGIARNDGKRILKNFKQYVETK